MNNHRKKLPLKQTLDVADTRYYDYDAKDLKSPKPWTYFEREMMYPSVHEWIDHSMSDLAKMDTEPTSEIEALFDEAREFVEQLTGYYLADVVLRAAPGGATGVEAAKYTPTDNTVRYYGEFLVDKSSPEVEYEKHVIKGFFVHELMHATNRNNYMAIGVRNSESNMRVQLVSGLSSVDMRGPILETLHTQEGEVDIRIGQLFEEAAAEEAAARWREKTRDYDLDTICHFDESSGLPSMPHRYVNVRGEFIDGAEDSGMSPSAYCAEAIRQISIYTGTDIFDLMLQSRDVKNEASARRQIAQAIESVEKGLYSRLRDANYTAASFKQNYEYVLGAIATDKSRKNTMGKLATAV